MRDLLRRLRHRLARPALDPEERRRRLAERHDAEMRMRHEIEQATLYVDLATPGDRPRRFVR